MGVTKEKIGGLDGMPLSDIVKLMDSMGVNTIGGSEIETRNESRRKLNAEHWDQERRRYRPGLTDKLEAEWRGVNRLSQSDRSACELYKGWTQLERYGRCDLEIDHTREWKQDGRLVCVTTEPYHLDREKLAKAINLCEAKDLSGYIHYAAEVHAPDDCIGIVFVRKGEEAKLPTLVAAMASRSKA